LRKHQYTNQRNDRYKNIATKDPIDYIIIKFLNLCGAKMHLKTIKANANNAATSYIPAEPKILNLYKNVRAVKILLSWKTFAK